MKLYDSPLAPNPRRVRWLMAEKGVDDIEVVTMNLMAGEHREADYVDRAGQVTVPVLELDDGTLITESIAICRYLESLYPEPNMFGRDPLETAKIEMWTRRAELMAAIPSMLAVRHLAPPLAVLENQDQAFGEFQRGQAIKGLELLDRRLGESPWLGVPDRITIADIVAFTGIEFARVIRLKPDPSLANLNRWLEAMRGRDAAKAAV